MIIDSRTQMEKDKKMDKHTEKAEYLIELIEQQIKFLEKLISQTGGEFGEMIEETLTDLKDDFGSVKEDKL